MDGRTDHTIYKEKMNQTDIGKLLLDREFKAEGEPPPEEIVFRIEFQTIGSLGDYALITGRPKAGKTKYLAGAMAAAVSRKDTFGMKIRLPDNKRRVVHWDTEQGKRSHFNCLKLMLDLAGLPHTPDYFKSYHCRQDNAAQIIAMIDHYIRLYPDTGIMFLDGLLDLIDSFNDEKHSKFLVNWLKRITEANNLLIIAILHRSMSVDKSIGHLGSSADRAAQSVLIVEKNKETKQYILKAEYLRDGDDFTPVAIYYNKQMNLWEQTDYIDDAPDQQPSRSVTMKRKAYEFTTDEHTALCYSLFTSDPVQSYDALLQRIKEVYGVGRSWAVECVKILEKENLVWRVPEGFTNIRQGKIFKVT